MFEQHGRYLTRTLTSITLLMMVISCSLKPRTSEEWEAAPQILAEFDELRAYIDKMPGNILPSEQGGKLVDRLTEGESVYRQGWPCRAAHILNTYLDEMEGPRKTEESDIANDLFHRGLLLQYDILSNVPDNQVCRGRWREFRCAQAPWAELQALSVTVDPERSVPGDGAMVAVTVQNRGSVSADSMRVEFTADGDVFTSQAVESLPGCSETRLLVWWSGGDLGPHKLAVRIDAGEQVAEGMEANNTTELGHDVIFELVRPWERPDLQISDFRIEPMRLRAGETAQLQARVSNRGDRPLSDIRLRFLTDGEVFKQTTVSELASGEERMVSATWDVTTPGRHYLAVVGELPLEVGERFTANNHAALVLNVGGEPAVFPDLQIEDIHLQSAVADEEGAPRVSIRVTNIGWAPVAELPLSIRLDGERIADPIVADLSPGGSGTLEVELPGGLSEGEHTLWVEIDPYNRIVKTAAPTVYATRIAVPAPGSVCIADQTIWQSLGPDKLDNGSQGRTAVTAIDPAHPNTIYVGAPTGGIWKTTKGGNSWTPLGDYLPSMDISALIMDPSDARILYAGSKVGLYKSTDSGKSWSVFTGESIGTVFRNLMIRYTGSGKFVFYAGSDKGVWRYEGSNKWQLQASPSQWTKIKSGMVTDLIVHPTDVTKLYAAVYDNATNRVSLFRSKAGAAPSGDNSWDKMTQGLPANMTNARLALAPSKPDVLYALTVVPSEIGRDMIRPPQIKLFRSPNGGDGWAFRLSRIRQGYQWFGYWENWYSSYVVVSPDDPDIVYMGHVQPYRWADGSATLTRIVGVHDDQHGIAFHPSDPKTLYLLGDGGIFKCTNRGAACTSLNEGLRVMQFYDIALAKTNPKLIIGGTQDNGTIRTDGAFTWKMIRGNDGRYVAIDPTSSDILYSQEQYLDSTAKGAWVGSTWTGWRKRSGLPSTDFPYLLMHPQDPNILFAAGTEVYRHDKAKSDWTQCPTCDPWTTIGPNTGTVVTGSVTGAVRRIAVDTGGNLYAGTSGGQIWTRGPGTAKWTRIFTHSTGSTVTSLVADPVTPNRLWASFGGTGTVVGPQRVWLLERIVSDKVSNLVYWKKTNITNNLPNELALGVDWRQSNMIAVDPSHSNTIYVATDKGVYRGRGSQTSTGDWTWYWDPYNCGLPWTYVSDLEVHPVTKALYAATYGRGIFTTSLFVPSETK